MNIKPFSRYISRKELQQHIDFMTDELFECADAIDELRSENMILRIRGEYLAQAIEENNWTPESAMRMSDCVSAWREFEEADMDVSYE
jgi:hypothetical protein